MTQPGEEVLFDRGRDARAPAGAGDTALQDVLDRTLAGIAAGGVSAAVQFLMRSMDELVSSEPARLHEIAERCRTHPLHAVLLEDPFSDRAWRKPNGYSGDATTIDYLYFRTAPEATTPTGRAIFEATTASDAGRSVRFRRSLLARYIDRAASRTTDATLFSVGCGHLREAGMSRAACDADFGRFVALDRDPRSIERVSASYGRFGVEPILGSVEELLERGAPGTFDLVYAADLYNHLADPEAQRLTTTLFRAVRPGGSLVVCNFARRHAGHGYLGACLEWTLLGRSPEEMAGLASGIPRSAIADSKVFADPSESVLYLELVRAAASVGSWPRMQAQAPAPISEPPTPAA